MGAKRAGETARKAVETIRNRRRIQTEVRESKSLPDCPQYGKLGEVVGDVLYSSSPSRNEWMAGHWRPKGRNLPGCLSRGGKWGVAVEDVLCP